MSQSKDRHEAQRWLDTANEDLRASRALAEAEFYAHACFSAQQCAEKAIKAMWFLIGADPWGHSVQKLLAEFPGKNQLDQIDVLVGKAATLDRFYIPTRYPNGLPDLTPGKSYFPKDAEQAIGLAAELWEAFRNWIETN